jgi:hypothetical protein
MSIDMSLRILMNFFHVSLPPNFIKNCQFLNIFLFQFSMKKKQQLNINQKHSN